MANIQQNELLALHESRFEPGDISAIKTACDFVQKRQELPISERIHVIWYVIFL